MMSDGCGEQQKNSHFAAMCLKLLTDHTNLKTIDHKFFETGHTEMECDSLENRTEIKICSCLFTRRLGSDNKKC